MLIHLAVLYKVPDFVPRATTIAPFTIFHEPFPNSAAYPVLSNWQTEIRFFLIPGIYLISSNVHRFPEVVFMQTSPFPSISKDLLSARYTFPKFPDLKFWNNSLLGDEWKDAPESKIHDSTGLFTLRIRASPMSSAEFTESLSSPNFWFCFFFGFVQFVRKCPFLHSSNKSRLICLGIFLYSLILIDHVDFGLSYYFSPFDQRWEHCPMNLPLLVCEYFR